MVVTFLLYTMKWVTFQSFKVELLEKELYKCIIDTQ